MPKPNQQNDPRYSFATLILPCVLGVAMFIVYCATLNHWINLSNLGPVATACGWMWQPQLTSPLTCIVTAPFHWLNPAHVPLAMNVFAAACAALTLALLARCVAILPQDRTEPQRQREKSDFSFLTGWQAYLPPIIAVLFLGLQLTFWKHATNFTGEMFDELLFAIIIWLLLEYRLDERPWRLTVVCLLYGACMAESWVFIAFFPLLVTYLIWVRGLEFFNLRFLVNSILCGLAGLSLIFLLPILAKFTPFTEAPFWQALKVPLREDWTYLSLIKISYWQKNLALASLSTLLPALLISLKWSANFGDNSRLGSALANTMVVVVSMIVMGVCAAATFDPPFSAGQILPLPCLSLYFIGALCIGYFSGYFLLVFSKNPVPSRRDPNPRPLLPKEVMWICPIIVGGFLAALALGAVSLGYRSLSFVRETNGNLMLKFAQAMLDKIPAGHTVLLGDGDNRNQSSPIRTLLAKALLAREGKAQEIPVVDTSAIVWAPYHRFLQSKYHDKWPLVVSSTNNYGVTIENLYDLFGKLSASNTLCYLNPSYGYYFERYYLEPRGTIYVMRLRDAKAPLTPTPDQALISENEAFWTSVTESQAKGILQGMNPDSTPQKFALADWVITRLHAVAIPDENAQFVGAFYSRCMDDWGVRLQRDGKLEKAAQWFETAKELNPDNVVADINLSFNQTLRTNGPVAIDLTQTSPDRFGNYRDWNSVLDANGPFDDISFCYAAGWNFNQNGMLYQASEEFERVLQLAPRNLDVRMKLASNYIRTSLPGRAMAALQPVLTHPEQFGLNIDNMTQVNILAASIHFQMNEVKTATGILDEEVARHPDDETMLKAVTQAYLMRGLYTNALHVIHVELARSPDDKQWLYGKSYASYMIGNYADSIAAMTRVLQLQTNNDPVARFNRALSYFKDGQLDNARSDYLTIQNVYSNAYQVAFGLGKIADAKHETNEAIRNYQIYLANTPTNTAEYTTVRDRLTQLRGH